MALGGVMKMCVLILVLVEDGLRALVKWSDKSFERCLNPCCCGRWSQRRSMKAKTLTKEVVLILVLVEDGLREERTPRGDN